MCRDLIDGVVLVNNSEISAAIKDVFNDTRQAGGLERSGCRLSHTMALTPALPPSPPLPP